MPVPTFEMTTSLQERVRALENQLEEYARKRRQRLLVVVVGISLLAHAAILLYLSGLIRPGPAGGIGVSEFFEMSILDEQELSRFDEAQLRDLVESPEMAATLPDEPAPMHDMELTLPTVDLSAESGQVGTLAQTSGGEGIATLSGGGAGASFFGISSRGNRFAYIMDMSGSMSTGNRWDVATRELVRSVDALPDFTHFHVVLFSTGTAAPPRQRGWVRAGNAAARHLESWLNSLAPTGGTMPAQAFHEVFALDQRPEVIFFMTDGEIPQDTPEIVAGLNERGQRVVINTVAFGDPAGQAALKRIAEQSGGVYRHIPVVE
jgi:hypothetical protein